MESFRSHNSCQSATNCKRAPNSSFGLEKCTRILLHLLALHCRYNSLSAQIFVIIIYALAMTFLSGFKSDSINCAKWKSVLLKQKWAKQWQKEWWWKIAVDDDHDDGDWLRRSILITFKLLNQISIRFVGVFIQYIMDSKLRGAAECLKSAKFNLNGIGLFLSFSFSRSWYCNWFHFQCDRFLSYFFF